MVASRWASRHPCQHGARIGGGLDALQAPDPYGSVMPRITPAVATVLLLAAVATACSSGTPAPTSPGTTSPAATLDTTVDTTVGTTATEAAAPVRERLDWLLGLINAPVAPTSEAVAAGFTAEFLTHITVDELITVVGTSLGTDTGWTITDAAGLGTTEGTATITSAEGRQVTVTLAVEPTGGHLVDGLEVRPVLPVPFADGEVVTAEAVTTKLAALGERTAWGLFEAGDDSCTVIAGSGTDAVQPLGSAFKLWILAALATEIEAGRASWDETMPVTEGLKSSPDGEIAPLPAGTPVSLQKLAEVMIAISDNTATDHLLARLGRETVEAAMTAAGVVDPSRNVPFLSTRELFLLKWGTTLSSADYLALDAAGRRNALDERLAGVSLLDDLPAGFTPDKPTDIDTIEWFATPADLCRTHVYLARLALRPGLEPVAAILSANPGMALDARWTDVRFKGGSEPGVLFGAWRLADASGRAYVLAGGVADTTATIDELQAVVLLVTAAASLAPAG
jgi:hypothetical protein